MLWCTLVLLFAGRTAGAQTFYSWAEYGVVAGASQYFGDLNDNYGLKYIRPVVGAFARFHTNPYIAIRGSFTYTKLGYDDKFSDNPYNRLRNLSFRSDVFELAVQSEFNFTRFSTGELGSRFTPYLTGGVGVFYYNPYAILDNKRYNLRRLGTEGQYLGYDDRKYTHFSACFPVGVGFKYWLRPGLNFGMEISDRLTLTDYLDDVSTSYIGADRFPNDPLNPNPAYYLQDRSPEVTGIPLGRKDKQRGNSQTKDQYMYLIFNLSFQLKVYKCPEWIKYGNME